MSSTTMKLPFKRFVAQVSTGEPRPKSSYIALMAENLEALKACPWREAADIPAALVDHDFTKASHFSDAYDAFKMTGAWDSKAQREVAFAGMAAYRFAIPAAAGSVAISSVTLLISRDRFLKGGVHVAAALSDDETPSANWSVVTGQGADGYLANDAANIVESRPAEGALTITSADLASLATTGRAYLWIYVTLEDYTDWWALYSATEARQYAIEGSAMLIGGSAEVTFSGDVTPSNDSGFPVAVAGGYPPFQVADRGVLSASCLAGGGDLPKPELVVRQVSATTSALYYGDIKLKDIVGDARGIRIFASNVAFSGSSRPFCLCETQTFGNVRNVQYFAVLGVDGSEESGSSYINRIGPCVMFFVRYDIYISQTWTSKIYEVSSVHNYLDNVSLKEADGSARTPSQDEYDLVASTYSGYLNANVAHRMLAERTAESITLVVGPGSMQSQNTAIFTRTDGIVSCRWIADYTANCGVECAVYVSGAAGVGILGKFFSGATYNTNNPPYTVAEFKDVTSFYPEGGAGLVSGEKALYSLYAREAFLFRRFAWYVSKRVVAVSAKSIAYEYTFGGTYGEVNASSETLIPFSADDGAGTLAVGAVGSIPYKGKIYGVVRYAKTPTSSALVYGDLEEADGRPCRMFFVVTVRANSLYVWIPPFEHLGRPDSYEQLTVISVRDDPDKVVMAGNFSSVGGRSEFDDSTGISGLCAFSLGTGTLSKIPGGHPGSDILSAACDNLTELDSETRPTLTYGGRNYTAPESGGYVSFFATGDHVESRVLRRKDTLPPAPSGASEMTAGLRCAYAKIADGAWTDVSHDTMMQPGAAFTVRAGAVPVPVSDDQSVTGSQDVQMWRIAATSGLVPFSLPGRRRPHQLRLAWNDASYASSHAAAVAAYEARRSATSAEAVAKCREIADAVNAVVLAAQTAAGTGGSTAARVDTAVKDAASAALESATTGTSYALGVALDALKDASATAKAATGSTFANVLKAIVDATPSALEAGILAVLPESARTGVDSELPTPSLDVTSLDASSVAGDVMTYVKAKIGSATSVTSSTIINYVRQAVAAITANSGDFAEYDDRTATAACTVAVSLYLDTISSSNTDRVAYVVTSGAVNETTKAAMAVVATAAAKGFRADNAESAYEIVASAAAELTWQSETLPTSLPFTEGAVFNVWLRPGAHLHSLPRDTLRKPAIYDAAEAEVDGWTLVATLPATATGDVTVPLPPFSGRVGTFLLTAYMPQDDLDPADFVQAEGEAPPVLGVGVVDADPVNGNVYKYATGWKPDITLI